MTIEELFNHHIQNYFVTRKNKRYGKDAMAYEVNWAALLIRTMREFENRTFRIRHNYAFLTSVPKWREIIATEFAGRLADHEVCDTISPFTEIELSPRTYNNRKGKGASAAILQVEEDMKAVSENFTKKSWIIKLDFKGYFPNALWEHAYICVKAVIDKHVKDEEQRDYLNWLAKSCIYANPAKNCILKTPRRFWDMHIEPEKSIFTKPYGVGAAIGRLVWQLSMGLYVNDDIKWFSEECGVCVVCFVDDIVIQVPDEKKSYALSLLPEFRKRLAKKNIRLNEKKFYCQPVNHGLEFLGSHIKPNRKHLNNKTFGNAIYKIDLFNDLEDKYDYIDKFMETVNSYTGLLKNRNDFKRIEFLRRRISVEWYKYLFWNEKKHCLNCIPKYSIRERLNKKYHLKLKHHETKRKRPTAERPVESDSRVRSKVEGK